MKIIDKLQGKARFSLTMGRITLCHLVFVKHVLAVNEPVCCHLTARPI